MIDTAVRRLRHLLAHEDKDTSSNYADLKSCDRKESYGSFAERSSRQCSFRASVRSNTLSRQKQGRRSTVSRNSSIRCSAGHRSRIRCSGGQRSGIKCSGRRKSSIRCGGRQRSSARGSVKQESISNFIEQRFCTVNATGKNRITYLEGELAKLRESTKKAITKSWEEAERVREENDCIKAEKDDLVQKCQELERKVEDLQRKTQVGNTMDSTSHITGVPTNNENFRSGMRRVVSFAAFSSLSSSTTGNSQVLQNSTTSSLFSPALTNKEASHKPQRKLLRFDSAPLMTVQDTSKMPRRNSAVLKNRFSSSTSVEDISPEESEWKSRGLSKDFTASSLSTIGEKDSSAVLTDFSSLPSVDEISSDEFSEESSQRQQQHQQNESFLSALSKNTKDIISSGIQNSRMRIEPSNNDLGNISEKEQQIEELQRIVDKQMISIHDLVMEVAEIDAENIALKNIVGNQKDTIMDLEESLTEMQSGKNQVVKLGNDNNNHDELIKELQDKVVLLKTRNKEKEKELEKTTVDYSKWKKRKNREISTLHSAIGKQKSYIDLLTKQMRDLEGGMSSCQVDNLGMFHNKENSNVPKNITSKKTIEAKVNNFDRGYDEEKIQIILQRMKLQYSVEKIE